MLLEFSCSNHKSIKNTVTFSALAGKDTSHDENLIKYGDHNILKCRAVYGANGSGKSNLFDAVAFARSLVINSIKNQPGQGIVQKPHKLMGLNVPSEYKIQFIKNDVRYVYSFSLKNALVFEEYLYYFPNGRQTKIFERDEVDFTAGDKFRGKFDTCRDVLKPNRLLLSCAANFSSVDEVAKVFNFFDNDLVIYRNDRNLKWLDYSLNKIRENEKIKKMVLLFLKKMDTGIKDIEDITDQALDINTLSPDLSDDFKNFLISSSMMLNAKIKYNKFTTDLRAEESFGIKKIIELICPIIDILLNDKTLFCDELENSLHEAIAYNIVELFNKSGEGFSAQIFFTTHDTNMLDLKLFRRDQIWFTELDPENRGTDLYSLAEIRNVRKEENVSKGYISGKYGAIPMLNERFNDIVQTLKEVENE